ncbi:hypothetical protein A8C32_17605 [Flavivirga aquatica]|uniref:Uncharacterized protein n=1 Tax=Flavivirga aquatica TaxID=1849968 RepID=A0A1E5T8A7_9FLAO|nr:hypothetical protein [Flavivirga aquatica]OEK07612.1 hypothetical protein A8C32_17605 [Flavivirga aquatica]
MKLFWKINICASIIIFGLFVFNILVMYFEVYIPNFLLDASGLIFIFSPFLEVIQIPICLVFNLITLKKQKKIVWMYFLMMAIFFIIKISIYALILGSIISLNQES